MTHSTLPEQLPAQALPWAREGDDVLKDLDAAAGGLSSEAAQHRIASHGRNELPPSAQAPAWKRFLSHFDNVLIYILLAAAVLKAISNDWVDFAVIVVVAIANAVIGFVQEGRSRDALASLRTIMSVETQVLRDGVWAVVDAADLVPGDVIRVRSGDRVPADARILHSTNLQVDESALTGESVAAVKDATPVGADAGVGDRASMLHSGTIVSAGTGLAVVTTTGSGTEIGQISSMVAEIGEIDTPLTRQLSTLGKRLSILIGAAAAVMLIIGRVLHDFSLQELLSAAIGFAVAAVPEGLPALVTVTLALGVQQMARRKAITRRMASVETLGSVTVICSDKTGTLTQNEMTARTFVTAGGDYDVTGSGYEPVGSVLDSRGQEISLSDSVDTAALVLAVGACNDAKVEPTDSGWRVVGQPTEGALAVLATKASAPLDGIRRIAQVPFESTHKFSAALSELPDGQRMVHIVGAPDRLLDRCETEFTATAELRALDRRAWESRIDDLSAQGLRVLAAGHRPATADEQTLELGDLDGGLTFLGIVGIVDPPRPEVVGAIRDAHDAGIRVKMITGDHVGTAVAIARELGIVASDGEINALTGAELEAMSQEDLRQCAREVDVYARTSPEHKLRIVRALQSHHEVVAMTGDGINDAPSITRADVGVAMGIKGTEATKEAADIVLADDNFATIERAVEEGRRIYDNIRKSVVFLLPTNGAQSLVILVAVLLGMSLPLSPVQILWVNLVTAVTLSLTLVGEPAEPDIMRRPPRPPNEQVLSGRSMIMVVLASLLIGGATLAVYLMERDFGESYAVAQTTAVTMLAMGQLAFLLNCRFLNTSSLTWRVFTGNRVLWFSIGTLVLAQALFSYAPFMNLWFDSAPIGIREWALTIGMAAVVFLLAELGKAVSRRLTARRTV